MTTREDILITALDDIKRALTRSDGFPIGLYPDPQCWMADRAQAALDAYFAAPTPPAAEAPGQEPVAYLVEHAHSGPVLSWKPPTAGAEAYGWVGTPLFPPTYADAEAKGWQTMDSAPLDGTKVDLWVRPHDAFANGNADRVADAIYKDGKWRRPISSGMAPVGHCGVPTHWRSRPTEPDAIRSLASPAPKGER